MEKYDIFLLPLSEEDGGGYLGLVPDLQGCMSDGETRVEAIKNTELAIAEYIDLHERTGRPIPAPGTAVDRSRAQYASIISALRDMTSFAEEATAEVCSLREVIDRILIQLKGQNWCDSAINKMASDARKSISIQ